MKEETKREVAKSVAAGLCLICGKKIKTGAIRGNHAKCVKGNYYLIQTCQSTDEELIDLGMWLPRGKRGRKPSSPAFIKLQRAKRCSTAKK